VTRIGRSARLGLGLAVSIGLFVPSPTWAQAAKGKKAAPTGTLEIEEITVTAQKREENIQEIPVSVSAVSGAMLEERGAKAISDLVESVPNLFAKEANQGSSSLQIGIRGALVGDPSFSQNPTVGLHVDGFYIAKIEGANMDLEDLDRVEVLRGPQGTLYGKNTIGGAVNLITKKPTEERSITAATEVGNFDSFKGRVTLNVPLIGKNGFFQSDAIGIISLRENVSYRSHEPYIDNQSPTNVKASGGAGMANTNRVSNMTSVRWQPRKDITIDYAFEYHRYRQAPNALQVSYLRPGSVGTGNLTALGLPAFFNQPSWDLTPYVRPTRQDAVGSNVMWDTNGVDTIQKSDRFSDDGNNRMHFLTGAYDAGEVGPLGSVTLKAMGSYRSLTATNNSDIDGSPLHMFDGRARYNLDTWSGELQWIGSAPRVHYVGGLYYYGEHTTNVDDQVLLFGLLPSYRFNRGKVESFAPYGQVTWTPPILNDKLSVTAGLRYTQEHVKMHATYLSSFNMNALTPPFPIVQTASSWDVSTGKSYGIHGSGAPGLSPMGDISYQWTDNVMTYFRVSRGFQSGVANGRAGDPISASKMTNPEKLLAYEGGFKSQWFDNRLRLNADGFFSDYTDRVLSIARFGAGGSTNSLENAGTQEVWGAEVEMVAIPLRGLEITGNYAYLTSQFTEWNAPAFDAENQPIWLDPCGPGGTPFVNCQTNQKIVNVANDRKVPVAPHNTFSIGVTYTAPPTTHGVFSAHLDTYYSDTYVMHPEAPHYDRCGRYAVLNGRLQFVDIPLEKGSLDLAVFGRNLTDEKYRVWGFDLGGLLGWAVNSYSEPRTFGLGMTYHFTAGEAAPPPPAPVAQAAPPPPPAKKKIVLRSVHFDFDKATLKADAKPILEEAVQVLKQEGSVDIVVEGHTDSVGTDQYNLGLSRRRADTVRRYLIDHGVAASRITAEGMGESKPVASNDTADGRAQNRRVELHVK